jgi:hypothetical protein
MQRRPSVVWAGEKARAHFYHYIEGNGSKVDWWEIPQSVYFNGQADEKRLKQQALKTE